MNKTLWDRRAELIAHTGRGVALRQVVIKLSKKYEVAERTIYSDWARRKKWMPLLMRIEDPTLLLQLIAGMQEIIPAAWTRAVDGDNTSAQVGALRLAKETIKDLIEILQSAGYIEKRPDELKAEITGPEGMPLVLDPVWQQQMSELQKQIKEKRNAT